ncbi:hypothetical protein TNCV_4218661 [Trichonephila clavipes]|nr:hypothetical protein TNCV_4218661 [Trichonephila clavipes]
MQDRRVGDRCPLNFLRAETSSCWNVELPAPNIAFGEVPTPKEGSGETPTPKDDSGETPTPQEDSGETPTTKRVSEGSPTSKTVTRENISQATPFSHLSLFQNPVMPLYLQQFTHIRYQHPADNYFILMSHNSLIYRRETFLLGACRGIVSDSKL